MGTCLCISCTYISCALYIIHIDAYYTIVSQPSITRYEIGTVDLPQITIHYGPFSTELGSLSTYQIVVIESGEDIDTMQLGKETLLPQDRTFNK